MAPEACIGHLPTTTYPQGCRLTRISHPHVGGIGVVHRPGRHPLICPRNSRSSTDRGFLPCPAAPWSGRKMGAHGHAAMTSEHYHLHLISDSTGETLNAVLRAGLAPFSGVEAEIHVTVFVRSAADLEEALDQVGDEPGSVIYTLADPELRARLVAFCAELNVPAIAALDPVFAALSSQFGQLPQERPGMQHGITTDYFDRIEALDFAISHDDGALGQRLSQADVILTGVSRTSKTPTCIYLAYRGVKAANVPLVPRTQPDPAFFAALDRGVPVIGLTASPARLSQIRSQRLEAIGSTKNTDYAEIDTIRSEVADALLFFDRYDIPVIDVTRRSIEETAAEILATLRARGIIKG